MLLTDALFAAALLLTSAGVCAGALLIASRLHLTRAWPNRTAASPAPDDLIEQLVGLADAAKRHGIMSVEFAAGELRQPLLKHGIELLLDGKTTPEVRDALEGDLDRLAVSPRESLSLTLQAVGLAVLLLAAAGAIKLASSGAHSLSIAIPLAALPAALVLTAASVFNLRNLQTAPRRMLENMLSLETICWISRASDGRSLRAQLKSLLPGQAVGQPGRAAA